MCTSNQECLKALASKMFSSNLINKGVQQSPSIDGIIDEFKASIVFLKTHHELEDHCSKFLISCIEIKGALEKAAGAIRMDLIEEGMKLQMN